MTRKNLEKIANALLKKCIWKTKKEKIVKKYTNRGSLNLYGSDNHETVSYRSNKGTDH